MPEKNFRENIPTFIKARRALILCAALALITIQVVDRSIFEISPKRMLSNINENELIAITTNPKYAVRHVALMIPADGPDPSPHNITEDLRRQDPEPIDPLCSATSRIKVFNTKTLGKNGKMTGPMIFQSMTYDGQFKTVGGDEYYVKYTGNKRTGASPDAVAHITDLDDGTYELHFVQPLGPIYSGIPRTAGHKRSKRIVLQAGKLEVYLDYTCGIGNLGPGTKNNWIHGGSIHSQWEVAVDSLMVPSITMAEDRPLPQQFGSRFRNHDTIYRNYDAIYGVGDSLMRQYVTDDFNKGVKRRSNFYYQEHKLSLDMKTLSVWMGAIDQMLVEHPDAKKENCAIVLGSGVWDVLVSFESIESHIEAMEKYIEGVRSKAPLAHIYWKSMTGLHRSVFDEANIGDDWAVPRENIVTMSRNRLKYCSSSRAKAIYEAQLEVLQRMKIPVLDMYNMTYEAEEWHNPNESQHYQAKFNDFLMDYFFPSDNLLPEKTLSL